MLIRLAVQSLVLLRNRLAVERKRPWRVKAQNSSRLALGSTGSKRSLALAYAWEYTAIGKHRSELYS
jgi:hypothetical protein